MYIKDITEPELLQEIQTKIASIAAVNALMPSICIILDARDASVVHMSPNGCAILGVTMDELAAIGPAYHDRFFNPEEAEHYVPKIMKLLDDNGEESISFFQQVRPSAKHEWIWYLTAARIFFRDREGKPLLVICTAIPIDKEHHITAKVERLLQENAFLRQHGDVFAQLTKREKLILKHMALGQNSPEIAASLHISETTAATHRRNIKRKLKAQSNYDIMRFAQAFNII